MSLPPGHLNLITDVSGLSVGQSVDAGLKSGVTVVLGDAPMVAGVHVMGGAPGTRETDLLRPDAMVPAVDAVVLSGGSAFGLSAADGVTGALKARGRGIEVAGHRVPIVPAAILFDLAAGGDHGWSETPYPGLGAAALAAASDRVALGSEGAGTGAIAGRLKGGLGSASARLPDGTTVGAIVAVNPVGCVACPVTGRFWAAPFEEGDEFGARGAPDRAAFETKLGLPGGATTIAAVATDASLTKAQATRIATVAHDGMARAILPAHMPFDGDLVFALSTGRRDAPDDQGMALIGHAAAVCLSRAIARGVYHARPADGDPVPTWARRFG